MKFLNNINLSLNELQNAKIHNLAAAPTGYEGLVYYDTTAKKIGVYANGSWKYLAMSDLLGTASGVATLNASTLVVQNPANAATVSGGAAGKIPISSTGGKLDDSYIPTLDSIPLPIAAVALNGQKITGLAEPAAAQDAATKNYVDSSIQGLKVKTSVRAASTANITMSGTQTIDGVALIAGNRVLLKNQTAPAQNGIWTVAAGAWVRTLDADLWSELVSAFVFVEAGTLSADTGWTCTVESGGTINTTAVTWVQFSAAGQLDAANVGTGTGTLYRNKTGTTINLKTVKTGSTKLAITNNGDDVTLDIVEANLTLDNIGGTLSVVNGGTGATTVAGVKTALGFMSRYAVDIGTGALTTIAVTHSLGTLDVQVSVYEKTGGAMVFPDISLTNTNSISLVFAVAPTLNQYRVVVVG